MEDTKTVVDFAIKKTEEQWTTTFARFWLAATPKLFEWFRWVLTLAALSYVHKKTHNVAVGILVGLTYAALLFYYFAFFKQFHFRGIPFVKSMRAELVASVCLSALLGFAANILVRFAIDAVVSSQP